jgi:twinkle protein
MEAEEKTYEWMRGDCVALENRGLRKETCEKWQYEVSRELGCHIANYRTSTGELVAQKIRKAGKKFSVNGVGKDMPLYGMWLWGAKGRKIIITEGEIDALSVSQSQKLKWPVVSLPNGAQSAEKVLKQHYEYLDGFDEIVIMFDMDDAGREAAQVAASVLPIGKVLIATLPEKDANEVLLKHGEATLVDCFWKAQPWRPDGIVDGSEFTLENLKEAVNAGFSLPWPALQERMLGLRKGELTLLTAGSGIGKSHLAREGAYYLHQQHRASIGNVFLEEGNKKTAQGYIALHHSVPLGRLRHNPSLLTDDQWREAIETVVKKRMWFYDHFGSLDSANLLSKLRYLASVCKVDFIILDHISIVTSGMESSSEGERKDIDILMTRLRSLAEETGVGIVAIVHLKRAQGKSFNEGDQISLNDMRGSASLEQLSDNVIGIERNQQAEGDEATTMRLRLLKCRETGETGPADVLNYNRTTGRLELPALEQL